jgi:hypothetical protein
MNILKKTILPVLLATIWISISEFLRNEVLFKSYWIEHYASQGMEFPSEPINGAMWGLWSLLFAISIFVITRKFNVLESSILAWVFGFVMMWVVLGNLSVLPFGLLLYAVPLSMLEVFLAVWIIKKVAR